MATIEKENHENSDRDVKTHGKGSRSEKPWESEGGHQYNVLLAQFTESCKRQFIHQTVPSPPAANMLVLHHSTLRLIVRGQTPLYLLSLVC